MESFDYRKYVPLALIALVLPFFLKGMGRFRAVED